MSSKKAAAARTLAALAAVALAAPTARADDKSNCIAAASAAQDLRTAHKLIAARDKLLVCAQASCPPAVSSDCTTWLAAVRTALPTISVSAQDPEGHDLVAVKVALDGSAWIQSLDGQARPVDPGAHKLAFESDGMKPQTLEILAREGEQDRAVVVHFAREKPTAPPPTSRTVVNPRTTTAGPAARAEAPAPSSPRATWLFPVGIGALGVGVVTAAVGAGFAVDASSKWTNAQSLCKPGCSPGSPAYAQRDAATTSAGFATGFIVGGAIVGAAGLTMMLLAPHGRAHRTVAVGPILGGGTTGVSLAGTF